MSVSLKPIPVAESGGQAAMRAVRDWVDVDNVVTQELTVRVARQASVNASVIHRAVAIKRYAPDLVDEVIRGELAINPTYEVALQRRKERGGGTDKSVHAREERDRRIRQMAAEGYREEDIAAAIGITPNSVRIAMYKRLGIQPLSEKLGRPRRLDSNRIMEGLVTAAEPSPDALATLDWDDLDLRRIDGWQRRLAAAIRELTAVRNRLRRTPRAIE